MKSSGHYLVMKTVISILFILGVFSGALKASPDLELQASLVPQTHLDVGQTAVLTLSVENVGSSTSVERISGAIGEAFVAFPVSVVDSAPCAVTSFDLSPPAFNFFWSSDVALAPGEVESCIVTLDVISRPLSDTYRLVVFTEDTDDPNASNDSRELDMLFGSPLPIPTITSWGTFICILLLAALTVGGSRLWKYEAR